MKSNLLESAPIGKEELQSMQGNVEFNEKYEKSRCLVRYLPSCIFFYLGFELKNPLPSVHKHSFDQAGMHCVCPFLSMNQRWRDYVTIANLANDPFKDAPQCTCSRMSHKEMLKHLKEKEENVITISF